MSQEDIDAGHMFASGAIEVLREVDIIGEPLIFYASMIGTHLGNIVAHIGKDATLAMIDSLRNQIESIQFGPKSDTTH